MTKASDGEKNIRLVGPLAKLIGYKIRPVHLLVTMRVQDLKVWIREATSHHHTVAQRRQWWHKIVAWCVERCQDIAIMVSRDQ